MDVRCAVRETARNAPAGVDVCWLYSSSLLPPDFTVPPAGGNNIANAHLGGRYAPLPRAVPEEKSAVLQAATD